jgi:mannosyl-3-phosphoglycerate phosphatase
MRQLQANYIVFSDLDGTLLDHHTYSYEAAVPALSRLRELEIPLILVSSKTRAELIDYQIRLKLTEYPFVVENGSAFFTRPGYFNHLTKHRNSESLSMYLLGKDINHIRHALEDISKKHKYEIRGFHNSTLDEIVSYTGLSKETARNALNREFSIPVFFDERAETILKQEIRNYGLTCLYGGRFMHILGQCNKGDSLRQIMNGYRRNNPDKNFVSVALGDSLNDFDMLKEADYPVLVKKTSGGYEDRAALNNVIYSPGIGPEGWNISVLAILQQAIME